MHSVPCTRVSTLHVSKSPTECLFWPLDGQEVTPNFGKRTLPIPATACAVCTQCTCSAHAVQELPLGRLILTVWWGVPRGAYRALCTRCARAMRKVGHSPPPVGSFLGVGLPQGTIAIVYPCSITPPPPFLACMYPSPPLGDRGRSPSLQFLSVYFFFVLLSFNSSVHISKWTWIPRLRGIKESHPQDNFIVYIALFWTLDNSENTTRLNFGCF